MSHESGKDGRVYIDVDTAVPGWMGRLVTSAEDDIVKNATTTEAEASCEVNGTAPESFTAILQDVLTCSGETEAEWRPKLAEVTERAAAYALTEEDREVMRLYGGMLDWSIFGKPGDALPKGLVLTEKDSTLKVEYDHRLPAVYAMGRTTRETFAAAGAEDVAGAVRADIESRTADAVPRMVMALKTTPEYQILQAFAEPTPTAPDNQPLSEYWKTVKTVGIEDEVRTKYQLAIGQNIGKATMADKDMRSRIRRLDDETMPATHSSTDETPEWLPRLTSAVYGWYINNYQYEIPGINQDTSEDGHLVREAFIRQVFEEFIVDSEVHAERIRAKYTGVDIDTALQGLAEAACTKYISNWAKKVLGPEEKSVFGPSSNILLDEAIGPHALAVRQPVGEFVEWAALHDAYRRIEDQDFYQQRQGIKSQPSPSINQIIPLDEQEKLRQEPPYARIEKADFANGATAMRLVLDERRTVNIPELTGNEDIVLRTPSQEAGWLVPAIPGYILVGEDKATGRFGFVRNPEEEPYQECAVLLPVAAIKKLSETYRGIGLDGLANDLVGSEAPTVSDLERLIRDYSTYTEPQVSSTPYRPNLESYVASVTNGYLEVQCTGANSFNVLSLQAAFGTTEAELLKGRVIKQGSMEIASRLGHAQTFFVHNGRQYILDATPTRPDEVDYSYIGTQTLVYMAAVRSLFSRKRSASDLQDRQPVTIPPRQPLQDSSQPLGPAPDKVVEYRLPEPTPEEKITGMLQAAEQQFQTIFNVSDAASLYEQVMKQPESDPARRLLCDFKQWQRQGIPAEQARRTAVYFRNCAADEQVRRQLGLQSYAPDFLLRLAGAADNFAAELERQA